MGIEGLNRVVLVTWQGCVLVFKFPTTVVALEVEEGGFAHAFSCGIDDGWNSGIVAIEAHFDLAMAEIAGRFVAPAFEVEGVVGANVSAFLQVKEFFVKGRWGEEPLSAQVESEAVEGLHAEGAVLALVVDVLDPVEEPGVELLERPGVGEVAHEELVAHGAEEALDFSFGSAVAHGGVNELDTEPGTDE